MSNKNGRQVSTATPPSTELTIQHLSDELNSLYDGAAEGILVVDINSRRFVRANRAICELLGYTEKDLVGLSISDIHPPEDLPLVLDSFTALQEGRMKCARSIPCLRKDGRVVYADIVANRIGQHSSALLVGFFRDVTEQNRTMALLRESEQRHRLIADNISDVIWTARIRLSDAERAMLRDNVAAVVDALLARWQFSFVSRAVESVCGYSIDEAMKQPLSAFITPDSLKLIRDDIIADFRDGSLDVRHQQAGHPLEVQFICKDGSIRWCEVVSAYLRDEQGMPMGILGITRDITQRRQAEEALRESESKLRSLFENLPDVVIMVDQNARIHFANRGTPQIAHETLLGANCFGFVATEFQATCRNLFDLVFTTRQPQVTEFQDIFGRWWSARIVPLDMQGESDMALLICADVTQEHLANEAVEKEQRLLRQLLELHERERRIIAYEIHDGFAQQLTGALFRMQAFKNMQTQNSVQAWKDFDAAVDLITRAIGETRHLISGLRPPILDESGIIEAVEYLVCEQERRGGPQIEFAHDVAFERLAPPLENAVFRIVQESLQNACRHSGSERVRIELAQHNDRIQLDVRDWGVGFNPQSIEGPRFGLQGIRERVRLLGGRAVIDSSPGKGTQIRVDLPFVDGDAASENADTIDQ